MWGSNPEEKFSDRGWRHPHHLRREPPSTHLLRRHHVRLTADRVPSADSACPSGRVGLRVAPSSGALAKQTVELLSTAAKLGHQPAELRAIEEAVARSGRVLQVNFELRNSGLPRRIRDVMAATGMEPTIPPAPTTPKHTSFINNYLLKNRTLYPLDITRAFPRTDPGRPTRNL